MMRIRPKRKPKKHKSKKGVLRIDAPQFDELAEIDIISIEEEDDEEPTTDFVTEYVAKSSLKRKTPKILELKGLDPDKVYGVECHKNGTFNVRQIRACLGRELEYY